MSWLLRKINLPYWLCNHDWIPDGNFQAIAFKDLPAHSNSLSVYAISAQDAVPEIRKIAASMAIDRLNKDSRLNSTDDFGYVVLSVADIEGLGIKIEASASPALPDVTASQAHRNLIELTDEKLHAVARLIFSASKSELDEDDVFQAIVAGTMDGSISADALPVRLRDRVSQETAG